MLKELRGYKILKGVRGQRPRDVDALVKAMIGLSDIFAAHRDHLSDLEINPIMVRAKAPAWRRWMCGSFESKNCLARERITSQRFLRAGPTRPFLLWTGDEPVG